MADIVMNYEDFLGGTDEENLPSNTIKGTDEEHVPTNTIKDTPDLKKRLIQDWERDDKKFVPTRASTYVKEHLKENNRVILTAPAGVGKSFISRHIALDLQKNGYTIILVYSPDDILNNTCKQTVFVVDDICGIFCASKDRIEQWERKLPLIKTIFTDNSCKIIATCRLQVYKDDMFKPLAFFFESHECNLISDALCLTPDEKNKIANTYIANGETKITYLSTKLDYFPLLCSLFAEEEKSDAKMFFENPFTVYKEQLDRMDCNGDDGKSRLCSLALCVIFNNQLNEKWFKGIKTDEERKLIENTCDTLGCISLATRKIQNILDTLDGTFICKEMGIYKTRHDKVFDFLAHYFGQKILDCLITYGDSDLVRERFVWHKTPGDTFGSIDFIIEIPDDVLELYLKRLIYDWLAGKVKTVFNNNNLKKQSFRKRLLQEISKLDEPDKNKLANITETLKPQGNHGSGNTPLIGACYGGFTDMVKFMLTYTRNVDQSRDNGVTALYMASQNGHYDIVELLLTKDPNVNLCASDYVSPLYIASQNGNTDIVRSLLAKDAKVDLCDTDGISPLYLASQEGHIDIVSLLLDNDDTVDRCAYDGASPLIQASQEGYFDIVYLLLTKGADVNRCDYVGRSSLMEATQNGHINIVELLLQMKADCNICIYGKQNMLRKITEDSKRTINGYKQYLFDMIVRKRSLLTEYDKRKSIDILNVVAGSSPLHIASFMGSTNVVNMLLRHKANVNMKKEGNITPLFYACEVGHEEIVSLLLEKAADTSVCKFDGKSPLDIATENGHSAIAEMIKNPK